jgi:hypothetical protein
MSSFVPQNCWQYIALSYSLGHFASSSDFKKKKMCHQIMGHHIVATNGVSYRKSSTIQSNKTFLKAAQSCSFSLLTLVQHFETKITAAGINLAIKNKWHVAGHGNLFHSIKNKGCRY